MLNLPPASQVYLTCGTTDLRKSIDGLAALVQEQFQLNPFSASLFVFCNRRRDKLKILQWDHAGFWLFYRRLERGTFQWPGAGSAVQTVSPKELRWMLDGLSLTQHQAHRVVNAQTVL